MFLARRMENGECLCIARCDLISNLDGIHTDMI